jgi:hypothetical protein
MMSEREAAERKLAEKMAQLDPSFDNVNLLYQCALIAADFAERLAREYGYHVVIFEVRGNPDWPALPWAAAIEAMEKEKP